MTLEYIGATPLPANRPPRANSPVVRAGDFLYFSGQVPMNSNGEIVTGSIEVQTRQVMENIKAALTLAGASFDDVCKSTCWLEDARDMRGFNSVYLSYFPKGLPARSCVLSSLLVDVKLEVEVIVYSPKC